MRVGRARGSAELPRKFFRVPGFHETEHVAADRGKHGDCGEVAAWHPAAVQGSRVPPSWSSGVKREMAGSLRALADAVGRSHAVVQRWAQRDDWPFAAKPPWDAAQVRDWARTTLGPNPADGYANAAGESGLDALRRNPLGAAKLKLTLTRAAKLELERAALAGELINRREIEVGLVRRAYALRAAFQAIPRQVASELVNVSDENAIEELLQRAIDGALMELSQRPELPQVPGMETNDE